MLKSIAKRASTKLSSPSENTANIDNAFYNLDLVAVSGWIVIGKNEVLEDLIHFEGADPSKIVIQSYSRKDVEEAISVKASQVCYGFVAAVAIDDKPISTIKVGNTNFDINKIDQANSLSDVTSHLSKTALEQLHELTEDESTTEQKFSFYLDERILLNENTLFIRGWCNDQLNLIDSLVVSDGNTATEDFYSGLARFNRPDLKEVKDAKGADLTTLGFYAFIDISGLNSKKVKVIIKDSRKKETKFGDIQKLTNLNQIQFTKSLLSSCDIHDKNFLLNAQKHLLPTLATVWKKEEIAADDKIITSYGNINADPQVSVIIPIYGRYDFIAHQISAFKKDKSFDNFEVIYVLDDPKIEREFNITAEGVFRTYKLPFTTVFSGKNLGFSGANNLGVSIAQGKRILLLNSDILPSADKWLERLNKKFDQLENPGILGTKLVYEDDTIQHLGMEFTEDSFHPGIWMNYHPNKGFPSNLLPSFKTKEVQAVTGACMLMDRDFYLSIDGLDQDYILGDFEDSDLCLKCHNNNKKIYLDDEEKLYHLERLSQDLVDSGDWKFKLTLINGTRQISKWNTLIQEVRARYA